MSPASAVPAAARSSARTSARSLVPQAVAQIVEYRRPRRPFASARDAAAADGPVRCRALCARRSRVGIDADDQGGDHGRRRRPDRVPADLVHRASDPRGVAARLPAGAIRRLRDRDPDRRDVRGDLGILRQARRNDRRYHARSRRAALRVATSRSRSCRRWCSGCCSARRSRRTCSRRCWWRIAFIVGGFIILGVERRHHAKYGHLDLTASAMRASRRSTT